jgi:hypothetical protein
LRIQISIYLAVGTAIYTETLFKKSDVKGETFLDQQFWLYLYGSIISLSGHWIRYPDYGISEIAKDLSCKWRCKVTVMNNEPRYNFSPNYGGISSLSHCTDLQFSGRDGNSQALCIQ